MNNEEEKMFDKLGFENDSYKMLIHGYIKKWIHGIFYGFLLGFWVSYLLSILY